MVQTFSQDSHFTNDVRSLINRFSDKTVQKDSVLDRAISYFQQLPEFQENIDSLEQKVTALKTKLASASAAKKKTLQAELDKLKTEQKIYKYELKLEAQQRHQHLQEVCLQLIDLSEGESFDDTLRKSAQFLGTIQLISPTEGKQIAAVNERHKPIYKAVLCLRLLDELILSEQLIDPYIKQFLNEYTGERYREFQTAEPALYQVFVSQVKMAIVIAAVSQDIGNYHPDAQNILTDGGTLSPYRTLQVEDRKRLLQISFRETNRYIVEGLSTLKYVGNSKQEKLQFNEFETNRQLFIRRLLKGAVSPKKGIGNLLKVPQIYASIIMSTKSNYSYKVLPKVFNVLNLNAERGACSQNVVDSLYKITGMFPQGYGVTFVPKASDGSDVDYYEYAVVCQFYPSNPEEPLCRQATRKLAFIGHGQDLVINKSSNLYFQETAQRFAKVSKKRLLEILELLSSNFEERKELDVLPRCWLPNDYFSIKNNQKLWNKTVQ